MTNKFFKISILTISMLFISLCLSACNSGDMESGHKPDSDSSVQPTSNVSGNIGIEKPKSFAPVPVSGKNGLGVYGSGRVEVGKNVLQVEINTSDLSKVKPGYTVSLVNAQKNLLLSGKVKSVPDNNSVSGDICNIEVALDAPEKETNTEDSKTQQTDKTQSGDNKVNIVTSSSSAVISGGKVTEDSDVQATINLPKKDGVFYVYKNSVHDGKDGKKYVWVSKKKLQDIKADDWKLQEVKTGDTDGKKIEILSGLDGDENIAQTF